jgi:putative serine protease PepD
MNETPESGWQAGRQTEQFAYAPPPAPWSPAPQADPVSVPPDAAGYQIPPPPPPSSYGTPPRRPGRGIVAALLAGLLGAGIGTGVTFIALDNNNSTGLPSSAPIIKASGQNLEAVAAVAKAVLPTIVRIDVSEAGGLGSGTGSGVIYRADGYIITNNHVIEGASDIEVTLASGQQLSARVIGTAAPGADIAVVKVDRTGLPVARLGSIGEIEVGDLAVAMGSPFGLSGTVTAGVISALHRNITLGPGERFADAIQTDAPINPGNSGGALANAEGKVVGINTAIVGGNGGNVGVGFAIPIDIARRVADQIIATGKASLPFIGISGQNLPDDRGALVQEVVSGGPSAGAGIRPGDIIVELGGTQIHSMDELISTLIQHRVGESIRVVYTRNGQRHTVTVKLAARPAGS